jgi:hypothetical protein
MRLRIGPIRIALTASVLMMAACSSADFEVAEAPGADTSSPGEETAADSAITPIEDTDVVATDTRGADTNVAESNVSETIGACAAVSNPFEIWVDATSTVPAATGTSTCPFRHIVDAIKYENALPVASPRTIRVRAGEYTEGSAIILRSGLTLSGAGVGVTKLAGGGTCYGTTGYVCIVRVDGGAILERVTVDAGPTAKHGVVTGSTGSGLYPIVRSTLITNAVGDGNAGILATSGAILGPNIDSSGNRYGLVIWGNQTVKVIAGTNKFDRNALIGINHEGTGTLTFEGGSVSGNGKTGIKLGEPYTATPPLNDIKNLIATNNIEVGVLVGGIASARIRSSTITGSKVGVVAVYGASNYIDLGNAGSLGGNNFGSPTVKNSLASVCALFTKSVPLDATGNTFPLCDTPRSIADVSTAGGCEAITAYADVWYRGTTVPITASCSKGM